jgi:alpha-1,3-rhamnosyl/mannosyltransferase
MTCWLLPETHTAANVSAARRFADSVMQRAAGLIAVSENTKRDAVRILGLDPDRVAVIYSGVPEAYFDAVPAPALKPYVLFVGTIEPRKNIGTLLDAWDLVRPSLRAEFDLQVAGPAGWHAEEILARLRSGTGGVRYLGYVPETEMPGLTAGATVFVYPSLYEGFGFPLAQAMAAGVPAVTSTTSCLPEVAGGAALLADPLSPAELASAIERLLLSPSLRADLGGKGRARAERYRWEQCARESWEFFRGL